MSHWARWILGACAVGALTLGPPALSAEGVSDLWQTQGREDVRAAIARYLRHRFESGDFRAFEDPRLAARFVVESCATWAVHIHWDRAPERYGEAEARANAIDFVVRGLLA